MNDEQQFSPPLRLALQYLLRDGTVQAALMPEAFAALEQELETVNQWLAPLELLLNLDTPRGLAFLGLTPQWALENPQGAHPLMNRPSLTAQHMPLLALLRRAMLKCEQQQGMGTSASVSRAALMAQFGSLFGSPPEGYLERQLEYLRQLGLIAEQEDDSEDDQIAIAPIVAHLLDADAAQALLEHKGQSHDEQHEPQSHTQQYQ